MHKKCDSATRRDGKFCKQGPVMANSLSWENVKILSQSKPDGINCYNSAQCQR